MTFKMTGNSRIITVYNYRADTGEFIGKGDAMIPPFTGLPVYCTCEIPPQTSKGLIPVYDRSLECWKTAEDHRGEVVFDTETGEPVEITEPGEYPEGTTTIAPDNVWQKWDGKAWVDDPEAKQNALAEEVHEQKNTLLKQANEFISVLQDALDLDMATDSEKKDLMAWRKYRVLLTRIEPEDAKDIEWPVKPA